MNAVPFVMGSPEWHAMRARHVGGSEVAALFHVQPDYADSLYALWHIKAGHVPPREVDNERVKWGNRLEAPIAHGVAEDHGWTIEKGGYVADPTTPGLGCTLDYIVHDPKRPDPGALEIKNVDAIQHRRAWTDGEPPLHIGLQLQHQLACTGYEWGVVACLAGGNAPFVYPYKRKPALIADIRRRVTEFWKSIDEGREPPVDGSDAASAVIRALYPDVIEEEIDLSSDNELPETCDRLLGATEARKAAEKIEDECKNRIFAKLAGARRGYVQGFRISVAVTPEKPDRIAEPGEIIKGRRESRRLTLKELAA